MKKAPSAGPYNELRTRVQRAFRILRKDLEILWDGPSNQRIAVQLPQDRKQPAA